MRCGGDDLGALRPDTYKDAAWAYRIGYLSFEELHQVVQGLQPPVPRKRAHTFLEVYQFADEPPDPNSFLWIDYLTFSGHLSAAEREVLRSAASSGFEGGGSRTGHSQHSSRPPT